MPQQHHPEIQLGLVKETFSRVLVPVIGDLYIEGSVIATRLLPGVPNDGWNKLHLAAWNGDIAGVQSALAKGINHIAGNINGWMPIHLATQQGHTEIVRILLAAGGMDRINCGNELGWTPLHVAAWSGHVDIINLLLEYGMEARQGNKFGWNPAHGAAWNGKQSSLEILRFKVGLETGNNEGWNTIHLATWNNKLDIVKWLVETCNVDIDSGNEDWWHSLHIAAWLGEDDIASFLFSKNASITAGSQKYGVTPVQLAKAQGHTNILDIFHVLYGEGSISHNEDM